MQRNSKVDFIPPIPKREQHVGIYCRVSTNSMEQLQSLTAQVSHLTKLTSNTLSEIRHYKTKHPNGGARSKEQWPAGHKLHSKRLIH